MVKKWLSHILRSTRTRLGGAFLIVGIIAATLGTVSSPLTTVHAQFGNAPSSTSGYGTNTSSCEIETVGWVICPVMRSIAKLADYGFAFINQNFLKIEYGISNSDSGVYKAWSLMLSIANILFVLAFMWIIYAQITGKNAGGYSIKRMLPRLIIAAILVNVSYFACVIAIEISNIVGGSILTIMQQVTDRIGPSAMTLSSAANGFDDSRLSDITSAILTKQGTVWILLAPVAAVTVSIAIICAAGLVLLIMRKVVVAMLVLVSPLMFVTYLLPNTEKYFQQWLRLFFQLLLLYPVIAFLLGTGQIISATIINVGSESDSNYRVRDDSYNARNGGSGSATTDLAAAGAAVLPLLGTWFLLKSLSSVVTNAGTKVAGSIGRRGKNEEQKIKAQMDSKAKQSVSGSGLPVYERRPAFNRLRRRRSATSVADNLATSGGNSKPGSAAGTKAPSLFDRAVGNVGGANGGNGGNSDANNAENKPQDTQIKTQKPIDAESAELNGAVTAAANADPQKKEEENKKKTAKDIFNNLNKTRQSGGGNSAGGASGGSGTGNSTTGSQPTQSSQPVAPTTNHTASAGVVGQSSGGAASQPQQVIAIPVQVDASSFLGAASKTSASSGMPHPPTTEIESKAKERANKYLFDAQSDVSDASDKLDELKQIRIDQEKAEQSAKDHKDDK